MHDPYFIDNDPSKGGTVDMVMYVVPQLLAKGYTLVRVDEVPEIASQLPPPPPQDDGSGANASSSVSPSASATPRAPAPSTSSDPATKSSNASAASGDKGDPCRRSPQDSR